MTVQIKIKYLPEAVVQYFVQLIPVLTAFVYLIFCAYLKNYLNTHKPQVSEN